MNQEQDKFLPQIAEQDIVNPIERTLRPDQKAAELCRLSIKNRPLVDDFIQKIDARYDGTKSSSDLKKLDRILSKAERPAIKDEKPWFAVEHIRDGLRFRTALNDLNDLPKIIADLLAESISIVKAETGKMIKPKLWGWKAVMYDIRMPDGQLVEYYLSPREMMEANDTVHHPLYEIWRNKNTENLSVEEDVAYQRALEKSKEAFRAAWAAYLDRTGQSEETVKHVLEETDKLTSS